MAGTTDQETLNVLRTALAKVAEGGVASALLDGVQVTYHSPTEIIRAIELIESRMETASSGRGPAVGRRV